MIYFLFLLRIDFMQMLNFLRACNLRVNSKRLPIIFFALTIAARVGYDSFTIVTLDPEILGFNSM